MTSEPLMMETETGPATGSDFNPAALAAHLGGGSTKSHTNAPLWCILIVGQLAILAVIIVPSSTLFVTNAYSTVEQNADVILDLTISKSLNEISATLNTSYIVAHNFGKRPSTTAVILNALAGASLEEQVTLKQDWPRELANTLVDHANIATIACFGNGGPTPPFVVQVAMDKWEFPITPASIGTTYPTIPADYYSRRFFTYDFMDSRTPAVTSSRFPGEVAPGNQVYYMHNLDAKATLFSPTLQAALQNSSVINAKFQYYFQSPDPAFPQLWAYPPGLPYNYSADPGYQYMQAASREGARKWTVNGLSNTLYGTVMTNLYAFNGSQASIPSHMCEAGGSIADSLNPLLEASVPSDNGLIFVFDTTPAAETVPPLKPGPLIASSVKDSAFRTILRPPSRVFERFIVQSSPDPRISQIGNFLAAQNPALTLTGRNKYQAKLNGTTWYLATQELRPDDAGTLWQVVVAFPRSDFFHGIDSSIRLSIIVIAVLTSVGLIFILILSFAFTIPLRRLGYRMEEVTQMRFSSLENRSLEARSFVREIGSLENTFQVMVQAFAAGIRMNASLTTKTKFTATHDHAPPHDGANDLVAGLEDCPGKRRIEDYI